MSLLLLLVDPAQATESPYRALLDDPFPTAFAPVALLPTMYRWRGIEALPPGSKLEWDSESIQWSRIDERIVLPRARVKLEIPGVDGVVLSVWDRTIPLRKSMKGTWFGEAVVPLISGEASRMRILVRKGGAETEVPLFLERAEGGLPDSVGIDSSCSAWKLEIVRRPPRLQMGASSAIKPNSLILADCKIIRSASADGLLASLDVILFIDGAGSELKMNGSIVKAEAPSLFRLRLFPQNQGILIEATPGDAYELRYKIPSKMNRGFVGMGAGPYKYTMVAPGTDVATTAAVITLYGSYQISDSVRFTAFNATAIHKNFFTDTGFYLKSDSVRMLDQRVSVYLMLGANLIGYKFGTETHKKWGAPQGFEAAYRDFLFPNRSLVVGAFIYPPIDGKSYYNTWIRYGSSSVFGEMNYLGVRDSFEGQSVYARSVGFSIGFPLTRFF